MVQERREEVGHVEYGEDRTNYFIDLQENALYLTQYNKKN